MRRSVSVLLRGLAVAATLGAGSAVFAVSSYTPVNAPIYAGEKSVAEILGNVYGGTFTPSGNDLTNGTITAVRVADNDSTGNKTNLVNIGNTGNDDRVWTDGIASGEAHARFASYAQKFGYLPGASGGSYTNLFDVTGSGYSATGSFTDLDFGATLGNPANWRWARNGDGGLWSSDPVDNGANAYDHLVSYRITGLTDAAHTGKTTWMLFWEDLNLGDADYNDLAVEIIAHIKESATTGGTTGGGSPEPGATPEPATASLGLLGLAGLAAASRRRA